MPVVCANPNPKNCENALWICAGTESFESSGDELEDSCPEPEEGEKGITSFWLSRNYTVNSCNANEIKHCINAKQCLYATYADFVPFACFPYATS